MKQLFVILCIICIIIPMIVYTCAIIKAIQMDANCVGYLNLAADANSVHLAEKHLTTAINYLEANHLTSGNTSIIVKHPSNDISIWYENLKSAQTQLRELQNKKDLTDLEESNALMKLRESLTDNGETIHPEMISFYPSHVSWLWSMFLIWLLWILAIIFGILAYEA